MDEKALAAAGTAYTTKKPEKVDVGVVVLIEGLQNAKHLNGRRGIVIQLFNNNGRAGVKLFPTREKKEVSVKRENLTPLSRSLPHEDKLSTIHVYSCSSCGISLEEFGRPFFACAECKLVNYCSKKCQKDDWKKEHKADCKTLRAIRKAEHNRSRIRDGGENTEQSYERGETMTTAEVEKMVQTVVRHTSRLFDQKKFQRAEEIIQVALERFESSSFESPAHAGKLHEFFGFAVMNQGGKRIDEAVGYLEHSQTLSLNRSISSNLFRAYELQGDQESALEQLEMHLEKFPDDDPVYNLTMVGQISMTLNKYANAKNAYEKQIKMISRASSDGTNSPSAVFQNESRRNMLASAYTNLGYIAVDEFNAQFNSADFQDMAKMKRDYKDACRYFQMAKTYVPDDPRIEWELTNLNKISQLFQ